MPQPLISLCMIVRNEEEYLGDCLRSCAGLYDELCILDTGSTDKTIEIAKQFGAKMGFYDPGAGLEFITNFAEARNNSVLLATGQFVIWCDADDIFADEWKDRIRELAAAGEFDVVNMAYAIPAQGRSIFRERMFRRGRGQFVYPVHERLNISPDAKQTNIGSPENPIWVHRPKGDKELSHKRNLYILRNAMLDEDFYWWYLALEYTAIGDKPAAFRAFNIFLQLDNVDDVRRYEAYINMSMMSDAHADRIKYAAMAYVLQPHRREALVLMCQSKLEREQWAAAVSYARAFMSLPRPNVYIFTERYEFYNFSGFDMCMYALRRAGLYEEALKREQDMVHLNDPKDIRYNFSLIHATRGRPVEMMEARKRWLHSARNPYMVEHIFGLDSDDAESRKAAMGYKYVVVNSGNGSVAAWNAASAVSGGKVLIQVSDDFYPPVFWDDIILAKLGDRINQPAVLAVNDGIRQDQLLCIAIVTRPRYLMQGHLLHPGFKSVYSDDLFTSRAYRDEVVIEARDILFRHDHPVTGQRKMDPTYEAQNGQDRYRDGTALHLSLTTHKGLWNKYAVFIQATKDDMGLRDICLRMYAEGASKIFFGIPDEYWNGEQNKDGGQVVAVKKELERAGHDCTARVMHVSEYRATRTATEDVLALEAAVRNEMLGFIRADRWEHVLVVDGDELWIPGSLARLDEYINDNHPPAIITSMIPVVGLPGYPIEGAQDALMAYISPTEKFSSCRSVKHSMGIPLKVAYHFSATRPTMDEIIAKHRASGHYGDPDYDFEGWIKTTLPRIAPGMRNVHMYKAGATWPLVREWGRGELEQIPESMRKYCGGQHAITDTK